MREFPNWSMGHPEVRLFELSVIPGINDFFVNGNSLMELEEGRARAVLAAFKSGKWHSSGLPPKVRLAA